MACLCLITVGVTDVQFPVWKQDDYGLWDGPYHFPIGGGGCRAIHEGLLALLRQGMVEFPDTRVQPIGSRLNGPVRFDLVQEGDDFVASVSHSGGGYQIADDSSVIPGPTQMRLPLYVPKMQEALGVSIEEFGNHPYQTTTVVVLNTRRSGDSLGGRDEPIAAGPLVAAFLANRLNLTWVDDDGRLPAVLRTGHSTWVDLLVDNENTEERVHQEAIVRRLNAVIQTWATNLDHGAVRGNDGVLVITSGGIPQLKPITERVPATLLGENHVRLLDQPKRGATVRTLNYREKWAEREALRFHCAEALRRGDYVSAYGLSGRFDPSWAGTLRDLLGPLCDLPHQRSTLSYKDRKLANHELFGCQIEARLRANDVAGATVLMGVFMESALWRLIAGDARLEELGLEVDLSDECLCGPWPDGKHGLGDAMLVRNDRGLERHFVKRLLWQWPQWLQRTDGGQRASAMALNVLRKAYVGHSPRQQVPPQDFRNGLVHGATMPINLRDLKSCLNRARLIQGVGLPFGHNFFGAAAVEAFFTGLDTPGLSDAVGGQLDGLLNLVLGG